MELIHLAEMVNGPARQRSNDQAPRVVKDAIDIFVLQFGRVTEHLSCMPRSMVRLVSTHPPFYTVKTLPPIQ